MSAASSVLQGRLGAASPGAPHAFSVLLLKMRDIRVPAAAVLLEEAVGARKYIKEKFSRLPTCIKGYGWCPPYSGACGMLAGVGRSSRQGVQLFNDSKHGRAL